MADRPESVFQTMLTSLYLPRQKAIAAILIGVAATGTAIFWAPHQPLPASLLLAFALVWASMVDLDRMILPNLITLGLVVAGLLQAALTGELQVLDRVIGATAGYLSLILVAYAFRRIRGKDGLGQGDAKLLAAGGAWTGWAALPTIVLVASAVALLAIGGLVVAKRLDKDQAMAFGPFIAFGIWSTWLYE